MDTFNAPVETDPENTEFPETDKLLLTDKVPAFKTLAVTVNPVLVTWVQGIDPLGVERSP